ncbi:MAG: RNA polymerase sigma factor [Planctomycetota bacterium]|jgi:RNA polymerase sigma-70 factor (ECF subfamily)
MRPASQQARDELIVMRCQDGDVDAMDELVARWQQPLWRHACRLVGRADAAWEVVQDSWLGIIRGLGRLDDPKRFRPWAYRIVTYKAADWIRRHKRRKAVHDELSFDPPTDGHWGDEETEAIHAALAKVPAGQRMVLVLHYIDELPVLEIAVVLDIPEGTVKSRLHNGRARLRELLAGAGEGDVT